MRILQILDVTYPCGTSKHVVMLTAALRQRGHDAMVLCPGSTWLSGELGATGIPHLEGNLQLHAFLSKLPQYIRMVRKGHYDLIHSHMTRAAYCAAILGRLTRTPVVASVHTITHDIVYRRILPVGTNRLVCVSNFLRKTLLEQHIAPRYLEMVYNATDFLTNSSGTLNGSDAEKERATVCAELHLPADSEMVGLFGHGGGPKGYTLLIRAVQEIVAKRPRARFVFVGHVPVDIEHRLTVLAELEGVQRFLRFTGSRTDIPRLMRAMEIVTLPSEMETFGMVLIEAMALGKPVVGTNVGGIPEVIANQETGIVVEQTPQALSAALIDLLDDPARRITMGKAGQNRVQECFSVERMAANFEGVYRGILSSGRN